MRYSTRFSLFYRLLLFIVFVPLPSVADVLSVSTIDRPPFSFHNDQGEFTGFSIDLWNEIANRIGAETKWVEHQQFSGMVNSATAGETDLAISNISITSAREKNADFSQPIFASGMAIAVKQGRSRNIMQLIWDSGMLLFLLGALLLVFIVANVIWFFERNIEDARHDYFRDDYFGGVWDAFWWAFVIMTMGGFEKEVPHRIFNRLLAMFWIVVSLFFISTLTAKITTALTVAELKTDIEGYQDLPGKRVGVTASSSHARFLSDKHIAFVAYPTLNEMYQALQMGKLDAIVADFPILSYFASHAGADWIMLAGEPFNAENYGILLPDDSNHVEAINNALLKIREEGVYDQIYGKYFGENF